jgi:hypothetical protein
MAMNVRRIVTSHDASGKAVVKTDEQLTAVSRGVGANISGCEIWSTDQMPIDNSGARTEPKPWTTRSCCQVKLISNSTVAR